MTEWELRRIKFRVRSMSSRLRVVRAVQGVTNLSMPMAAEAVALAETKGMPEEYAEKVFTYLGDKADEYLELL